MDYKDYNDNELIYYICEGNEDATEIMLKKYEPIITRLAIKMSQNLENYGVDYLDLKQEGIVGLYNAVNSFAEQSNICFYTFATTCIRRRMYSYVGNALKNKNKALSEGMIHSLDMYEKSYVENILYSDYASNPEKVLLEKNDEINFFKQISQNLTKLEKEVLMLKLKGFTYKEIAKKINKDIKNVDNTLQRIRIKVQNNLKCA